jgi:hypothetical protein
VHPGRVYGDRVCACVEDGHAVLRTHITYAECDQIHMPAKHTRSHKHCLGVVLCVPCGPNPSHTLHIDPHSLLHVVGLLLYTTPAANHVRPLSPHPYPNSPAR